MHDMTFWLPIVLSAAGATVSFLTMLCVAIIGYLLKYVLTSTDRRIVDLEKKTEIHANHIAGSNAQTASEQKVIEELTALVNDMRERIQELATQIAALVGVMPKNRRK